MDVVLHALSLLLMLCGTAGYSHDCASIEPNSRLHVIVELGQNFTATCQPSSQDFTADDIKWLLGNNVIDKVHYRKVNATSVSVTLLVTSTVSGWLKCWVQKFGIVPCMYGISLMPGYPPLKPENLTCVALQDKMAVSSRLSCSWDPGARDPLIPTKVTLHANLDLGPNSSYQAVCAQPSICTVDLGTFPVYMDLNVWVDVKNALGSVSSEVQRRSAWSYVKLNPPSDIQVLSEKNFSSSVLVSWKHPIDSEVPELSYAIRYCQSDSSVWSLVPEDTQKNRGSYRISSLQPFTYYTVQIRCNFFEHPGYWSDWSANVTARTAEYTPKSRPDLWRVIQPNGTSRKLTLMWKDPVKANGKIVKYFLKVGRDPRVIDRDHLIINEPEPVRTTHRNFTMDLQPGKSVFIQLSAANSAGVSPESRLLVQESEDRPGVESVSWSVGAAGLQLDWVRSQQNHIRPAEYLLQWEKMPSALQSDIQWQRVPAQVNSSTLTGNFEPFVCYNVSVYPIYRLKWDQSVVWSEAGRAVSTQVYTQQGAPHHGPAASVGKSKKNSAELTWEEIPLEHRRGFITNYTIFYKTGNTEHAVTVSSDLHRYNLVDLDSESDYLVHVMASTAAGSTNGSNFNFKTVKYDDGQVELIVVLVCLGFFFLSICICLIWPKMQVIKQVLWPQVPDPSDSSVAHWSPDLPMKTDMPKEDVSVVEVDVFDRKSLFEEDKVALPLKKDKYLSEEHSSGIGGSSCMSSPRHSVSDSDEADSGQTTASTVQYSSVVASGYKGQTPSHQPVFSRSESTQPLLDCEEPAEPLHSRNSYCKRGLELGRLDQESEELNADSPAFCPTQEEASSDSDEPSGSGVCYMAQQNGYRPQ